MQLPGANVGPYLRALHAGLDKLAPGDDHVPLAEALAHLEALDPGMSGELLFPAEVDERSGLPTFPWMERALAEQALARRATDLDEPDDDGLARAAQLDPALGQRMTQRRALHRHLRRHTLLPISRLTATLRCRQPREEFVLAYDRMVPGGAWMRIRCDLCGPPGWSSGGLLRVRKDDRVTIDEGLHHLFTRHSVVPLLALQAQLATTTGAQVTRLSRSAVGPLWFPGLPAPTGAPPELLGGLLLHLSTEVVANDVFQSAHRDPWFQADEGEVPSDGQGLFRERRFAATPGLIPRVEAWGHDGGFEVSVVPLVP